MQSQLRAVSGQGRGNVIVTLTGQDKPNLHAELQFNVRGMPPNSTFSVDRRVDFSPDGECTGDTWFPLGPIETGRAGTGTAHFETERRGPFVSGFTFDIQYRVVGNDTELQTSRAALLLLIPRLGRLRSRPA